jgi:hypothetical protein
MFMVVEIVTLFQYYTKKKEVNKFEDIKRLMANRKSNKNRQYNGQKKKDNNNLQNTTQKTKD